MAKKSPAKVKMLVAQAKREAAVARAAKQPHSEFIKSNEDTELERYTGLDEAWREIGIALPARRANELAGRGGVSAPRSLAQRRRAAAGSHDAACRR